MKQAFVEIKLGRANQIKIEKVESVLSEYARMGYRLTLRQLYYRLVTENIIANNDREYDKLSSLLTKGRMSGKIDWNAIEDRIRQPRLTYAAGSVENVIDDAVETFRVDRMEDQKRYIELWVEKDALSNVLFRKTLHYHVRLMVNRGYSSTTAMYDAYKRILRQITDGKKVTVLYLGDHDPSGLDMVRDIFDRLFLMLTQHPSQEIIEAAANQEDYIYEEWGHDDRVVDDNGYYDVVRGYLLEYFEIRHIALTSKQVLHYDPPPNPAKVADPRAEEYIAKFGRSSWEVDALNPTVLHEIIDDNIKGLIDMEKFKKQLVREEELKNEVKNLHTVRQQVDAVGEIMGRKLPKKPTVAQLKKLLKEVAGAVNVKI